MSSSDVLLAYARRRGYLSKNSSKNIDEFLSVGCLAFPTNFVENFDRFQIASSSSTYKKELGKYLRFLKLLSSAERNSLRNFNRQIYERLKSLNKIDEFDENFVLFRQFLDDDDFNETDKNLPIFSDDFLIRRLSEFIRTENAYNLCEIFENCLKNCVDVKKQEAEEEEEKEEEISFNDSNFPSTSDENLTSFRTKLDEFYDDLLTTTKRKIGGENFNENSNVLVYYRITNGKYQILSADTSSDRRFLATTLDGGGVLVWNLKNDKNRRYLLLNEKISCSAYCVKFLKKRAFNCFLLGLEDGSVNLWRSGDGDEPYLLLSTYCYNFLAHRYPIFSIDSDSEGEYFVSSSFDNTARLFRLENNQPLRIFAGHSDVVQATCFVDGLPTVRPLVATASADKTVRLWSQEQAVSVRLYHCLNSYPTVIGYCSTAGVLACGSYDRKLFLVDVRNDINVQILDLHDFVPYSVDFDVGDKKLLVGGTNGRVKIFQWDNSNCKYAVDAISAFSLPGDGGVYCLKAANEDHGYSTAIVVDL